MSEPPTREEVVQELLSRGVHVDDIASAAPDLAPQLRSGMISPRLQAPDKIATRSAYVKDYSDLNSARDRLSRYYPLSSELDRFEALNQRQGTGGWQDNVPVVKDVQHWLSPASAEMASITSGMQGRARPAGSGATSDFEQRLYRQGVPSPEKQGPTNGSIAAYQRSVLKEENDRLAFQEEFMRRNGSLSGSQDAWGRYVASNPYLVQGPDGRSSLNTNRADWREHFGLEAPKARAPRNADGRPLAKKPGFAAALPDPQRKAAMLFRGAKAASGSSGNPYVPSSAAEFKNLPAGAWYIDDDGKTYRKGG